MCGIIAYLGSKEAYPVLIKGLKRLEYRGYDSAGVAVNNGDLRVIKKAGKVQGLEESLNGNEPDGVVGIGHTRWATHGLPNDINAHPQSGQKGRVILVHNGIIENYSIIKKALEEEGHIFKSETDTEVLAHLIEKILDKTENSSLEDAVREALRKVVGAYAIVVMDRENPDVLVGAKRSSPLLIGLGDKEFFLASDATPLVGHTQKVIYLKDNEMVEVRRNGQYSVTNLENILQDPVTVELDLQLEELEKGGYDHFMLKEIYQQPETIRDAMRGRVNAQEGWVKLGGMEDYFDRMARADKFVMAACGTSWHSALIGEYLIEDLARIPVEVEYASELRYRNPILGEDDVVIAISQSGETADTLSAIEHCKSKGALIFGIVNVVGSSISRVTHAGSYIHAGPEIGVASTKAFTGQVTILTLMALALAQKRGTITKQELQTLLIELVEIPSKVQKVLDNDSYIQFVASEIKDSAHALYLGRGYNFPVALEGALKLKEISYIHAEGYPAAEMKHGPIALIDKSMPVIVIATNDSAYDKIVNNIQEIKAREGIVISIVKEGDTTIKELSDYTIEVPDTVEPLSPLLSVIPLQLLSYHTAVLRGCHVDQPRNLAKSVTVE